MPATTPAVKVTAAEELDAVLRWRGKHAQAIRERDEAKETLERWHELNLQRDAKVDALQQRLTVADDRADVLEGLLEKAERSVDYHAGMQREDDGAPLYDLLSRIRAALKPANSSKPSTCTWSEGGFSWHTACGKEWQFTDGGLPSENGMHFCHSCGKTLVVESAESA